MLTNSLFADDVIFFITTPQIKSIINFSNSDIVFSSNCLPVLKDNISELFNIPVLDSPGKYFRFPF
ncbi:hypothetical protein LguiA_032730 [Lonicera macranthoides]